MNNYKLWDEDDEAPESNDSDGDYVPPTDSEDTTESDEGTTDD